MLVENPLLTVLGRRGRGAVVEALLRNPGRTWTVRDLGRFADVAPMVASRTVRELAALGAVEILRPGRDARIRLVAAAPAARALAGLRLPDLRRLAAERFAARYGAPAGVTWLARWAQPGDDPASPFSPTRIAVVARDPEAALQAAGPALDAVQAAGLPAPDVSAWAPGSLRGTDPTARAILAGEPLGPFRRSGSAGS